MTSRQLTRMLATGATANGRRFGGTNAATRLVRPLVDPAGAAEAAELVDTQRSGH